MVQHILDSISRSIESPIGLAVALYVTVNRKDTGRKTSMRGNEGRKERKEKKYSKYSHSETFEDFGV